MVSAIDCEERLFMGSEQKSLVHPIFKHYFRLDHMPKYTTTLHNFFLHELLDKVIVKIADKAK